MHSTIERSCKHSPDCSGYAMERSEIAFERKAGRVFFCCLSFRFKINIVFLVQIKSVIQMESFYEILCNYTVFNNGK